MPDPSPAAPPRRPRTPILAHVVSTARLSPHLVRVVLGGDGLAGFSAGEFTDHYVKLHLPPRGADYQAPSHWIDTVELCFDLDPAKTRILNRMKVRRNPDVPRQPLKLDGDELNLARVLVNGPLELARAAGADGIHLDSSAAARLTARPDCEWVGVSCHDGAELVRAAALGADFALLSPVLPTLTHPGAATLGWDAFSTLAAASPIPVYGLGGLGREDVALAQSRGAHGVALLRGAWT